MAVGTKDLAPEQLRGLDDTKLADELKKAKEELFNLRFQSATGQLDNHGRLRAVKKDIARIYTEMRERELGISGGHVYHAEAGLDQFFAWRPVLGMARYRLPVRGLYLCGSGAHPGGGITGAPGQNAANEILADLGR